VVFFKRSAVSSNSTQFLAQPCMRTFQSLDFSECMRGIYQSFDVCFYTWNLLLLSVPSICALVFGHLPVRSYYTCQKEVLNTFFFGIISQFLYKDTTSNLYPFKREEFTWHPTARATASEPCGIRFVGPRYPVALLSAAPVANQRGRRVCLLFYSEEKTVELRFQNPAPLHTTRHSKLVRSSPPYKFHVPHSSICSFFLRSLAQFCTLDRKRAVNHDAEHLPSTIGGMSSEEGAWSHL